MLKENYSYIPKNPCFNTYQPPTVEMVVVVEVVVNIFIILQVSTSWESQHCWRLSE